MGWVQFGQPVLKEIASKHQTIVYVLRQKQRLEDFKEGTGEGQDQNIGKLFGIAQAQEVIQISMTFAPWCNLE